MFFLNEALDGFGHSAGYRESAACVGASFQFFLCRLQGTEIHALAYKHTHDFFKSQHEVHIRTDRLPGCFQLLRCTGTNEGDFCIRVIFFHHPRGENHRCHGHGNVAGILREVLLCHNRPGRAAGCGHERLLFRHFLHEVFRFLDGAQVGTDGNFHHIRESQVQKGRLDFFRCHSRTELADKRRGDACNDILSLFHGIDGLENLALVHNGAKGAVDQALSAGNTAVVVDLCLAIGVGRNGVHAAGSRAGTFHLHNGVIGAGIHAASALDALVLVNEGPAVDNVHRILGAHFRALVGQASLALVGHDDLFFRAGVAGELDDVDQGIVIVFLGNGAFLDPVGQGTEFAHFTKRQTHAQTQALADDRPFQEDAVAVLGLGSREDFVRDLFDPLCIIRFILICHSGNGRKHLAANVCH